MLRQETSRLEDSQRKNALLESQLSGNEDRAQSLENRNLGISRELKAAQDLCQSYEAQLGRMTEQFRAREPLPRCPDCGALARPNVLMFGDGGSFDDWMIATRAGESLPPLLLGDTALDALVNEVAQLVDLALGNSAWPKDADPSLLPMRRTAVEQAYRQGQVPLAAAEGYIRQVLGWREYVRGVYWTRMPEYAQSNAWQAQGPLPAFYWTGDTDMECLKDAIQQTLAHGYAHHIQRLMITGLYALLLGVKPQAVHEWYLSVYVDAVEWVELPNTLGMSQYGDGGIMASKPYVASGKYIDRMSNHCKGCRYRPDASTATNACPFTTLYWDYLMRHEDRLAKNPRMVMQVRNLARLSEAQRQAIAGQARQLRGEAGT